MGKVGPSPRFAARQNRPPEFWQVPQRRDDAFRLLSHAGGIPRDLKPQKTTPAGSREPT
jgi:hypothetical protein